MSILRGNIHDPNDPLTIDTLEDLKDILENQIDITQGNCYIAFPEVYTDGDKVIDLRSAGWNPISFSLDYNTATAEFRDTMSINVYFNGWTILGLSMCEKTFFYVNFDSNSRYGGSVNLRIYDLIMKNTYVLDITDTNSLSLFRVRKGSGYGDSTLIMYRCKFSMVLDNQAINGGRSIKAFFLNSTEGSFQFNQCSFNIELANSSSNGMISAFLYDSNYSNRLMLVNCIISFNSKRIMCAGNESSGFLIKDAVLRFCKIVGEIHHRYYNIRRLMTIVNCPSGGSVYNVVDMTFISDKNQSDDPCLTFNFNGGVHIVNTDNFKTADNQTIRVDGNYYTLCTTAQMLDKDWLNDHYFICGDTPT